MDIKLTNTQVPTTYQRPLLVLQPVASRTVPVSADDIIDCVEIRTERREQPKNRTVQYTLSDNTRKEKGTLIDLWI
jgi:hypothetical protein